MISEKLIYAVLPWKKVKTSWVMDSEEWYRRAYLFNWKCAIVYPGDDSWDFIVRDPNSEDWSIPALFDSKKKAMEICDRKMVELGWKLISDKFMSLK
jgi:hypothetical protein